MLLAVVTIIVVIALALNVGATFAIQKDDGLYDSQKKAQIVLVWVVPIVGALITYLVRRLHGTPSTHQSIIANPLKLTDAWKIEEHNHSHSDVGPGHD